VCVCVCMCTLVYVGMHSCVSSHTPVHEGTDPWTQPTAGLRDKVCQEIFALVLAGALLVGLQEVSGSGISFDDLEASLLRDAVQFHQPLCPQILQFVRALAVARLKVSVGSHGGQAPVYCTESEDASATKPLSQ
jgi:hypothetical protein